MQTCDTCQTILVNYEIDKQETSNEMVARFPTKTPHVDKNHGLVSIGIFKSFLMACLKMSQFNFLQLLRSCNLQLTLLLFQEHR